ncbi:unnamed protein product, partial [Prorocentrum cordatum]
MYCQIAQHKRSLRLEILVRMGFLGRRFTWPDVGRGLDRRHCYAGVGGAAWVLEAFHEVSGVIANVMRSRVVLGFLPMQLQSLFASGLEVLAAPAYRSLLEQVGRTAAAMRRSDQKAFDLVRPSQLFMESIALGCHPRMVHMLLRLYRLPRRLKESGVHSEPFQVDQGILAGCAHAVCLLELLTLRARLRLREVHGNVVPRGIVGAVSVQYAGADSHGVKALRLTVELFQEDSRILGSCFNAKKSGIVVGAQPTKRLAKGSSIGCTHQMQSTGCRCRGWRITGPSMSLPTMFGNGPYDLVMPAAVTALKGRSTPAAEVASCAAAAGPPPRAHAAEDLNDALLDFFVKLGQALVPAGGGGPKSVSTPPRCGLAYLGSLFYSQLRKGDVQDGREGHTNVANWARRRLGKGGLFDEGIGALALPINETLREGKGGFYSAEKHWWLALLINPRGAGAGAEAEGISLVPMDSFMRMDWAYEPPVRALQDGEAEAYPVEVKGFTREGFMARVRFRASGDGSRGAPRAPPSKSLLLMAGQEFSVK